MWFWSFFSRYFGAGGGSPMSGLGWPRAGCCDAAPRRTQPCQHQGRRREDAPRCPSPRLRHPSSRLRQHRHPPEYPAVRSGPSRRQGDLTAGRAEASRIPAGWLWLPRVFRHHVLFVCLIKTEVDLALPCPPVQGRFVEGVDCTAAARSGDLQRTRSRKSCSLIKTPA